MKTLLALPLIAILAGCVYAPPRAANYGTRVSAAAPSDPREWHVVSVTPVAPGTPRNTEVTTEILAERSAGQQSAYVSQPAYLERQPVYVQQPVYIQPAPVYYEPYYYTPPVATFALGLGLGLWSRGWCCHGRSYHGRHR